MTLKQKKKLAEFMGWTFWKANNKEDEFSRNKDGSDEILVSKWNPDKNHKQFFEVWDELSTKQHDSVTQSYTQHAFIWMLGNELPKVMGMVLKELKIK